MPNAKSNLNATCCGHYSLAAEEVRRLDEMQLFWFFPIGQISRVEFRRLDELVGDTLARRSPFTSTPPGEKQQRRRLFGSKDSVAKAEDDTEYLSETQLANVLQMGSMNPVNSQSIPSNSTSALDIGTLSEAMGRLKVVLRKQPADAPRARA